MSDEALLVVDIQKDFCSGGSLAVPGAEEIIPVLNRYIERFVSAGLPVFFSRDWHPEDTAHFAAYGGKWPRHCVRDSAGAEFHPDLRLPPSPMIFSKGTGRDRDDYSALTAKAEDGTPLVDILGRAGITTVHIGGIATDYCVRETALEALAAGLRVMILADAVRGVDAEASARAMEEMVEAGAVPVSEHEPPGSR